MTPDGIALRLPGGLELWTEPVPVHPGAAGLVLRMAGNTVLHCAVPVAVTVWIGGAEHRVAAGYTEVRRHSNRLLCRGHVHAAGAEFHVEDVFAWIEPGLHLRRQVSVRTPEPADGSAGFASALRWTPGRNHSSGLQEWFLPGCVYRRK